MQVLTVAHTRVLLAAAVRVWHDGTELGVTPTPIAQTFGSATHARHLVAGRLYVDDARFYLGVRLDELVVFETMLSDADIALL